MVSLYSWYAESADEILAIDQGLAEALGFGHLDFWRPLWDNVDDAYFGSWIHRGFIGHGHICTRYVGECVSVWVFEADCGKFEGLLGDPLLVEKLTVWVDGIKLRLGIDE